MTDAAQAYRRAMLRSAYQSLFWSIILKRKQQTGFTLKALADKLAINKSYISRSFSRPPNWQIDKLSDMADALDIELTVEARDKRDGTIYTASGPIKVSVALDYLPPITAGSESELAKGKAFINSAVA